MSLWVDFGAIIVIQLALLLVAAAAMRSLPSVISRQSVLVLLVSACFGVVFDLIFGKEIGFFSYRLGFGFAFLIMNGLLSYGLWGVTIFLLRSLRLGALFVWTVALGAGYEVANAIFPVWVWSFTTNLVVQELALLLCGYFGLALLFAIGLRLVLKERFQFLL